MTVYVRMLCLFLLSATLARHGLAGFQEVADCDPLKKDSSCPPDPAFAGKATFDFSDAGWNDDLLDFWLIDDGTTDDKRRLEFNYNTAAAFGMWEPGQALAVTSKKYLLFGRVTVEVRAAKGQGLVTAIVLKSDTGDEIDWVSSWFYSKTHKTNPPSKELLGAYENQAQTNYFYNGDAVFNKFNNTYTLDSSSFDDFHTYTIEWTPMFLDFSINGAHYKTWHTGEIDSSKWPQTPMQVKLGLWAVDKDHSDDGLIAWAGGVPNWDDAPFKAYFKSVIIEDDMGSCEEAGDDVEYLYDEHTHGWQDIDVKGCKRKLSPGMYTPDMPSDQPSETGVGSGGVGTVRPSPSLIGGTGATASSTPTESGTDEAAPTTGGAPPQDTGGNNEEGNNESEDVAPFALELSSPIAAVVCLGWLLIL